LIAARQPSVRSVVARASFQPPFGRLTSTLRTGFSAIKLLTTSSKSTTRGLSPTITSPTVISRPPSSVKVSASTASPSYLSSISIVVGVSDVPTASSSTVPSVPALSVLQARLRSAPREPTSMLRAAAVFESSLVPATSSSTVQAACARTTPPVMANGSTSRPTNVLTLRRAKMVNGSIRTTTNASPYSPAPRDSP